MIVKNVDYTSLESLKEALAGQDAVVSMVGTFAIEEQRPIIDAALAVGVKRFIPSEFGVNTRKAKDTVLGGVLKPKIEIVDYLDQVAKENPGFSWTAISIGWFFDFVSPCLRGMEPFEQLTRGEQCLKASLLCYDFKTKTATIYDSGNEPVACTNLYFVAKVLEGIFNHLNETENRYIEVSSFNPSQNEIIRVLEEETGTTWTLNHVDTKALWKQGEENLAKGDFEAVLDLINAWSYQDGIGNAPLNTSAISLLGLQNEDLRGTIRSWVAGAEV